MLKNLIKQLKNISSDEAGRKLKNLKIIGEKTNYLIPETIVLTTDLYKILVDYNKISSSSCLDSRKLKIPTTLENEIISAIQKTLRNKTLVIRSSVTCEDSSYASFAGIFLSSLKIRNTRDILNAIRSCYTSFFSKKAEIYAKHHNIKLEHEAMSIGIQQLIPVAISGVTFTANPVFEDKNKFVVEHIRGLNTQVVAGKKSPKYIEISKKLPNKKNNLLFFNLIKMGKSMEKIFDTPQDIEWGFINNKFYIFQSRPITTLKNTPIKLNIPFSSSKQIGYGKPVVSGQCSGRLKLIKNANDYREIKNGDILLAKQGFNIEYGLPFMPKINGVITTGGALSHTTIIIREFQKPCLVESSWLDYKKYIGKKIFLDAFKGKIFYRL